MGRYIFTTLAVLAFAAGSLLMAAFALGPSPNPQLPSEAGSGLLLFLVIVWPIILLIVWICGAITLALDRRAEQRAGFSGVVVATGIAVWLVAVLINMLAAMLHLRIDFPLRGLAAVLVVLLCVGLNAGAVWYAGQYLFRGTGGSKR